MRRYHCGKGATSCVPLGLFDTDSGFGMLDIGAL